MKDQIKYEDFTKLDLVVANIETAEKVQGVDKLIRLIIDIGSEKRQLIAGIAEYYKPEELIGKQIIVLSNLEPRKFRGLESQGMLLTADIDGRPVLLKPEKELPSGSPIK